MGALAGGYTRTSYLDRDGTSHEAQRAQIMAHCDRHGYTLVQVFSEDERGVSGADWEAPELLRALEWAQGGRFNVLVVRDPTRFSRDTRRYLNFRYEFERAGVRVEYTAVALGHDDASVLLEEILAVIASADRRSTVSRLQGGRQAAVARGNVMLGGNPPHGYRIVRAGGLRSLEVVEDEAQWVRFAFELYAHGDGQGARYSLAAVARRLTGLGAPTPADQRGSRYAPLRRRGPGQWGATSVRQLLLNPVYKGAWQFMGSGGRLAVPVPAIVDDEVWERCQTRLEENKRLARRNTRHEYLLRGHIRCGRCGYRMHGRRSNGRLYYRCPGASRADLARSCDARMVRADMLDPLVWEAVVALFSDPADLVEAFDQYRQDDATGGGGGLEVLDAEQTRLQGQLARLLDLYLDGEATHGLLAERQEAIEARLAAIQLERAALALEQTPGPGVVLSDLLQFADAVQDGLALATSLADRRWYIDALEIQVRVSGLRVDIAACGVSIAIRSLA